MWISPTISSPCANWRQVINKMPNSSFVQTVVPLTMTIALLTFPSPSLAQQSLDAIMDVFDSSSAPAEQFTTEIPEVHPYRISGYIDLDMAWALWSHTSSSSDYDYQGLAVLRPLLSLDFSYTLPNSWQAKMGGHGFYDFSYAVQGRNQYTDQVLKEYENELNLDEVYLEGVLGKTTFKLGRQIVVWGESDIFRPLDITNPVDIRDPVFSDISGLRLPVWMSRADWQDKDGWSFSALVIHENRADEIPVYGNDFYPFDFSLPPREESGLRLEDTGVGITAKHSFQNWDASLYLASITQEQDLVGITADVTVRPLNRIQLVGTSANLAAGNWLYKADLMLSHGHQYYQLPSESKNRIDLAGGFDYSGFKNSFLTFEVAYRHLMDVSSEFSDNLDYPKRNVIAFGLRYHRSFFREKLTTSALIQLYGFNQGGLQQLSCSFSPWDNSRISAGIMAFQDGDNYIFEQIGKNDRLFLKYHYAF